MADTNARLSSPLDPKGLQKFIVEAFEAEEQLWTSLPTKGPLDKNVQELYCKARSGYVNAIFDNSESPECYDSKLWWLHYGLIKELRSRIKVYCEHTNGPGLVIPQMPRILKETCVGILNGFQNFLAQSTEFYKEMIRKLKESYGIPKECTIGSDVIHCGLDPKDAHKFQLLHHRFLIYLGDLERYKELYSSLVILKFNLSFAAHYYIKASLLYPTSGNPHNQLAVSAMIMGDELLAMYHFIRSLAIDEPFLKAWDNLILFFKNMLYKLSELHNTMGVSEELNFVPNFAYPFIQLISMFCTRTRLDELPYIYKATLTGLDRVLSLNDATLEVILQPCLPMKIERTKTSTFRVIQIVCILIFSILCQTQEFQFVNEEHEGKQDFIQLAWTAAFEVMGRLVHRCTKYASFCESPLLPGVLLFVEWCAFREDLAKTMDEADENCSSAAGRFFSEFIDFVNEVSYKDNIINQPINVDKLLDGDILWEDYELHAFSPLSKIHGSVFGSKSISRKKLQDKTEQHHIRRKRMVAAAAKLVEMLSTSSRKWIDYQKLEKRFYTCDAGKLNDRTEFRDDQSIREPEHSVASAAIEQKEVACETIVVSKETVSLCHPCIGEEDEVIIFKPTRRSKHNRVFRQEVAETRTLCSEASTLLSCNLSPEQNSQTSNKHSVSHALPSPQSHVEASRNDIAVKPASSVVVNSVLHPLSDLNISSTSAERKEDQKGYGLLHPRNYLPELASLSSRVRPPSLCDWMVGRDKSPAPTEGLPSNSLRCSYAPMKGMHSADMESRSFEASNSDFSMANPTSRYAGQPSFDNYATYPAYCSASPCAASTPSAPILTELVMNSTSPATYNRFYPDSALSIPQHFLSSSTAQNPSERTGTSGFSGSSTMNDKFHRTRLAAQTLPGLASGYGGYMYPALPDPMRCFHPYRDLVGTCYADDILWPDGYNLYSDATSKEPDVLKMSAFEKWISPPGHMFGNFCDNSYRDLSVPFNEGSMDQRGKEALFYGHHSADPVQYGDYGMDQRTDQLIHSQYIDDQEWYMQQRNV